MMIRYGMFYTTLVCPCGVDLHGQGVASLDHLILRLGRGMSFEWGKLRTNGPIRTSVVLGSAMAFGIDGMN
jgi:hypothetical protein